MLSASSSDFVCPFDYISPIYAMIMPPSSIFYRTLDELPPLSAAESGKLKSRSEDDKHKAEDRCGDWPDWNKKRASARGRGLGDCPVHAGGGGTRCRLPARYRVMLLLVWGFAVCCRCAGCVCG